MDRFISIVRLSNTTDSEGFISATVSVLATVRAFREGRHGSETWRNRAAFTEASDLYRIRKIPNLTVKTDMQLWDGDEKFDIVSVENVKGRNMYVEILVKEVKPSG